MPIKIIKDKITLDELRTLAKERYGDMVKAVIDIKKEIMAVGAEMHVDEEQLLLENGSEQKNLWGMNLYPDGKEFIEFDSMINIRPWQNNRSRGVEDKEMQNKIKKIVSKMVSK
jgi:hypothetical protein